MPVDPVQLPDAEALFEHATCALIITDKTGLILRANATFCGWLGYAREQLVGRRKLQELLNIGGRIFHQTHWMPLLQMQGSISEVKLEFKAQDGKTLPMILNVVRREHPTGTFDEVSAFVVIERHRFEQEVLISKRQAEDSLAAHLALQRDLSVADARLRVALESAQMHVWDVDPVTRERRYDDSVAQLLGYASSQTVSAAEYSSCIEPKDLHKEVDLFAAALGSVAQEYRCIYRLNGIDGVQRTVLSTGRAAFDPDDRLVQFVGILHDITDVTRAAEDRALFAEQMVGIVSHDLRNPLSVISMAAEMLERQGLTPKQQKFVSHAQDAAQRARRLINDLLDFTQARIGRGIGVTTGPVDLHRLIGGTVEQLRIVYPARELVHISHGEGACIADADRLSQLAGNLISNAVAYGAVDRPITVSTVVTHDCFELAVHNWGTPIPEQFIANVFSPMTRGVNLPQGTRSVGLGLFIVSEIVKAHGGTVAVTSTAEEGTTFKGVFPLI
ncbi:PAS domain-containing sensor histidine kinase [Pseudomonas sp. TWP3-2]|uniref:sensor histidine kinase n=1 Tax=Pseudomonas sp. TWP3-2 TaxID=2804574 RepID=UPI003CEEA6F5